MAPAQTRSRSLQFGLVAGVAVIALIAIGVALLRGGSEPDRNLSFEERHRLAGVALARPIERPDFTLTTTDGEPFHFPTETAGELTLLFFGYTSCPDICPIHLATIAGAVADLDDVAPTVVFVGVDTERDTPDAVEEFLGSMDADFIGLVGTEEDIILAQEAAGIPIAEIGEPDENGRYLVGHYDRVIAFTSDDQSHINYPFGVTADDWRDNLPRLNDIDWSDVRN